MGMTRFGCLPPRLDGEQTKSGFLPANLDSAKEFGFGGGTLDSVREIWI
jgi:hypothetical protein